MKYKSILILILIMVFANCNIAGASTFQDIQGHWAESQIEKISGEGLVNGYPDGNFKPDSQVTRAEFTVMLSKILNQYNDKAEVSFSDVGIQDWYYKYVASAYSLGYISGYPDHTFKANNYITREEAAVVIAKALKIQQTENNNLEQFNDYHEISDWSKTSIFSLVSNGIMQGNNKMLKPKNYITRAEAITLLDKSRAISLTDIIVTKPDTIGTATADVIIGLTGQDVYVDVKTVNDLKDAKYFSVKELTGVYWDIALDGEDGYIGFIKYPTELTTELYIYDNNKKLLATGTVNIEKDKSNMIIELK